MTFPIPNVYATDAKDIARDERKRLASPPSFFISRAQGLLVAARYFEGRTATGYSGTAKKHLQRLNSAFLAQMLAGFEWCLKDYVAMVLTATDVFDERLGNQDWVRPSVHTVLSQRSEGGTLGATLIHPTLGWHDVNQANLRFKRLFGQDLVKSTQDQESLAALWLLRHSLAHNAGIVTFVDAHRMRAPVLANKVGEIDLEFLKDAKDLLVRVASRLESPVGGAMLKAWFVERATGNYVEDKPDFVRLKQIATAVKKPSDDLPRVTKSSYTSHRKAAGIAAS